jgi:flavoprotein
VVSKARYQFCWRCQERYYDRRGYEGDYPRCESCRHAWCFYCPDAPQDDGTHLAMSSHDAFQPCTDVCRENAVRIGKLRTLARARSAAAAKAWTPALEVMS